MKKIRSKFLTIIFTAIAMVFAMAQTATASLWSGIQGAFTSGGVMHTLFYLAPQGVQAGTSGGIIAGRIMLIFLAFSVLFGASQIALGRWQKNIRLAITFIISLIAAFAIPNRMVIEVMTLWGGVLYAILVLVPVVGGTYLLFKVMKDDSRTSNLMKLLVSLILFYITFSLSGHLGTAIAAGSGVLAFTAKFWGSVATLFTILTLFYGILVIYYLIKSIFPSVNINIAGRSGSGSDAEIPEGTKKWFKRMFSSSRGRAAFGPLPKTLDELSDAISSKDEPRVKTLLKQMGRIDDRIYGLILGGQERIEHLNDEGKKVPGWL
mgnify:FL=1